MTFGLDADLMSLVVSWMTNKKSVHKGERRICSVKVMTQMPSSNDAEA